MPLPRKIPSKVALGVVVAASSLTLLAPDAMATTKSGSGRSCAEGYHVVTTSKSAGCTSHTHKKGSATYSYSFGTVSSSSPYRTYHSQLFRSVTGWSVDGSVLESGYSACAKTPV